MAQATVQQLRNEGWRVEQFGGALDATQFDAYLGELITEAGRWADHWIAGISLPPNSYAADCVRQAELAWCGARLWKRRAAFFDSSAQRELDSPAEAERRAYLEHAQAAMTCAQAALSDALDALGLPTEGLGADWAGMATGIVESGPYPPLVAA